MPKAITTLAWVLYWAGLVFAVLTLLIFSDRPSYLWSAVVVAIVFWGGAVLALVLRKLSQQVS
jgi:hypothetical protein